MISYTIDRYREPILGALSALAHAVFGVEWKMTPDTGRLMRLGLICSEDDAPQVLADIRAEKDHLAPDCKTCAHPCGRTAEYDLSELDRCDPEVRERKLILLQLLTEITLSNASEEATAFIFEGMRAFGEDSPTTWLDLLISRAEQMNQQTGTRP